MALVSAIAGIDATTYERHGLHSPDRIWVEKNCYVDVWIELIHALRLEPRAMLPFTVAVGFIGDQWTFFKPVHEELRELYGFDIQELNVWRPLIEHTVEHLSAGRLISTEADAFWLPDTAGTDYRRQHTKSTIIIAEIDVEAGRLGYFHNAGYFMLDGEDFERTFHLRGPTPPDFMPLFAEVISASATPLDDGTALRVRSRALWQKHLRRMPPVNPVELFRERLRHDFAALQQRGLAHYHAWAFANTRQLGAAFELAAANVDWIDPAQSDQLAKPFYAVASECKMLILKLARSVTNRKPIELDAALAGLATSWHSAVQSIRAWAGAPESGAPVTSVPTRETA